MFVSSICILHSVSLFHNVLTEIRSCNPTQSVLKDAKMTIRLTQTMRFKQEGSQDVTAEQWKASTVKPNGPNSRLVDVIRLFVMDPYSQLNHRCSHAASYIASQY